MTDTADLDVSVQSIDALETYRERPVCRIIADEQVGVENVSVGTADFWPGERRDRHVRDVEEIVIVLEGRGRVVTDDETHELGAGDVAIVSPGGTTTTRTPSRRRSGSSGSLAPRPGASDTV